LQWVVFCGVDGYCYRQYKGTKPIQYFSSRTRIFGALLISGVSSNSVLEKTTKRAVNIILSFGSAFSLLVGVLYLWVFPADQYPQWPHFLLLSFYIFAVLFLVAIAISLFDKTSSIANIEEHETPKTNKLVKILFALLGLVILYLYIIFNGH